MEKEIFDTVLWVTVAVTIVMSMSMCLYIIINHENTSSDHRPMAYLMILMISGVGVSIFVFQFHWALIFCGAALLMQVMSALILIRFETDKQIYQLLGTLGIVQHPRTRVKLTHDTLFPHPFKEEK